MRIVLSEVLATALLLALWVVLDSSGLADSVHCLRSDVFDV